MIGIYNTVQNLNLSFMKKIFMLKDINYHLRNNLLMQIPKAQTTNHGIESLSFSDISHGTAYQMNLEMEILLLLLKGKLINGKIISAAGCVRYLRSGFYDVRKFMANPLFSSFFLYFL